MSDEMKGRQFALITFKEKSGERDDKWCILNNLRSSFPDHGKLDLLTNFDFYILCGLLECWVIISISV